MLLGMCFFHGNTDDDHRDNASVKVITAEQYSHFFRDQSRYAPSQWETSLHCNDVSQWLGAYLDWSLFCFVLFFKLTVVGYNGIEFGKILLFSSWIIITPVYPNLHPSLPPQVSVRRAAYPGSTFSPSFVAAASFVNHQKLLTWTVTTRMKTTMWRKWIHWRCLPRGRLVTVR